MIMINIDVDRIMKRISKAFFIRDRMTRNLTCIMMRYHCDKITNINTHWIKKEKLSSIKNSELMSQKNIDLQKKLFFIDVACADDKKTKIPESKEYSNISEDDGIIALGVVTGIMTSIVYCLVFISMLNCVHAATDCLNTTTDFIKSMKKR